MIGIFDSGYGGLTILRSIYNRLPNHDYLYLGDNARNPYGPRSYEVVYKYTLECVRYLFNQGCHLVILACNTASAKALRTIQQHDLQHIDPTRRVLGVIRPTVEIIDQLTNSQHVGILGTQGTVQSMSYVIEIHKLFPDIKVVQQACPLWVPLIENNEYQTEGADFFIHRYLSQLYAQDSQIDTLILGCTHYPIIIDKIRQHSTQIWQQPVNIVAQGEIVARSLEDYLYRHPDIDSELPTKGKCVYLTTEAPDKFNANARLFMQQEITATQIEL